MNDEPKVPATVFGGKVAVRDVQALASRAAAAAQNNPRGGAPGGSDYMSFSGKQGVYTIGQDKRNIQPDELWLVDVTSFEEGFIGWKGGAPFSKRMANIYTGVPITAPDPEEGGPFNTQRGDGWFQAKAMVLKSLDNDQQGYLSINSVSGVSEMANLIGAFSERAAAGEACWPVVALTREQFEAQGFKNYKPIFQEVGWLTSEQMGALAEGTPIEELIELEDEPEVAPPTPATTSRRRRT